LNPQHSTLNSQLRLTFLGTGTSVGVPMIGCDCEVCRSPDPRDKRTRSSIYVETADAALLVDTAPDFRFQALRENIRRVDAVIFTHSHTDHVMGFDDLRLFAHQRGHMPVYASAETMADLRRVFRFAFEAENPFPGYLKPEVHVIERPFSFGNTTITPLPVPHGHMTVNGYLFAVDGRKLVAYLSDCSDVPEPIVREISEVEVLIIDGLRPLPHPTHLTVERALEIAARVQSRSTYLTHIAHQLAQSAEDDLPPNAHIAYDGLKLEL
jgi:phosphoribosyl 1,2-cyclic phosphate phosphodiesterase